MKFQCYLMENTLDDTLDLQGRFMYHWKGSWVIDTKHGKDRISQRNTLRPEELKKLFREALEKVKDGVVRAGETIMFWSKSLKQAFISKIDDQKNIKLITFLPRNKHLNDRPDTHEVVIEGINISEYNITRVVELP